MDKNIAFGHRILQERRRLELSQAELGELVGVSRAAQTAYEAGRSLPDLGYATRAVEAGLDLDYVLTGKTGAETAIEKMDWNLASQLMIAILEVADEYQLSLPRAKLVPLLKVLYELEVTTKSSLAPIDRAREMLRIAA